VLHYNSDLISVPTAEKVDADLMDGFKAIRNGKRALESGLGIEIRSSSLPICPRAYHISRRLPRKKLPRREEKFVLDATSLMGTALHLVLQKWFGLVFPDACYGNWECLFCKKVKRHKMGVQICPSCGREMIYQEYAIKKQKGLPASGHIDMILKFNHIVYLIDFKGAYQEQMRDHRIARKPKEEHYWQTNYYANAINSGKVNVGKLGKVQKIIIIYVERGKPHRLWLPLQVSPSVKVFRQTKKLIRTGKRSLRELEVPRGLCLSPDDYFGKWCKWKDHCFSPDLERSLAPKVYKPVRSSYDASLELLLKAQLLQ
jgi:hypothetical protein